MLLLCRLLGLIFPNEAVLLCRDLEGLIFPNEAVMQLGLTWVPTMGGRGEG